MGRRGRNRRKGAAWLRPEVYLRGVILVAGLGLVVLPVLGDATLAVLAPLRGEGGTCRVVSVVDGDTLRVWCPGQGGPERARLTGYDAPELFDPSCPEELAAAMAAKWALRWHLARAGTISLREEGRDRYGRRLVAVMLDDRALADVMIAAGHGRAYRGGLREGWCG